MSPIANTSGCAGSVRSGSTRMRPTASVSAPEAEASTPASPEARTPAAQMIVPARTRSVSIVTPSASMPVTRWSTIGVTPSDSSDLNAFVGQLRREGRQHAIAGLDEQDARLGRVHDPEVAPRVTRDLGDLPRHLDAGRPGAHDDEGQLPLTLLLGLRDLRGLEGPQDLRADVQRALERLQLGRVLLPLRVAEVVVLRAGADDQRVVGSVSSPAAVRTATVRASRSNPVASASITRTCFSPRKIARSG